MVPDKPQPANPIVSTTDRSQGLSARSTAAAAVHVLQSRSLRHHKKSFTNRKHGGGLCAAAHLDNYCINSTSVFNGIQTIYDYYY